LKKLGKGLLNRGNSLLANNAFASRPHA